MNCCEFRVLVSDLARERLEDPSAVRHAVACAACSELLRSEQQLAESLRFLRRQGAAGAPPTVELAVMAAYKRKHRGPIAVIRRHALFGTFAAAGVLAASLVVAFFGRSAQQAPPKLPAISVRIENGMGRVASVAPVEEAKTTRKAQRVRKGGTGRKAVAGRMGDVLEPRESFLALPFAPPLVPSDEAQIVRVRLPRTSLRAWGVPVNEDAAFERMQADVLLGQDGIARAVRFVSH